LCWPPTRSREFRARIKSASVINKRGHKERSVDVFRRKSIRAGRPIWRFQMELAVALPVGHVNFYNTNHTAPHFRGGSLLLSQFDFGDGSMQRSMLGLATLAVVIVIATIALTSETTFSETIQCRSSPGSAAPSGMHWYYRVDRTSNRYCWYMQAAGLPIHSQRHGTPSNSTLRIARDQILAPLQTEPTEVSQLGTAEADSTKPLPPSVDEPTTNFTARWSDLAQQESTTRDNHASEPLPSDTAKPPASTGFGTADPKPELQHKSASVAYFWAIFLAGALSMILLGGVLKLTRWLYRSVTSWWTSKQCAETGPSELVRA